MFGTPLPRKPKFVPGIVRGQLPRSPLRSATVVVIGTDNSSPTRPILEYPSHAETANEINRRKIARANQCAGITAKVLAKFNITFTGDIL